MDKPTAKRGLANRWDSAFELDAVRVFAAVAELASFRGAANALRLPRSTVSRRIADLEDALDTRLFQRTTRHVALTEVGEAFLRQVRPGLAMIADAGRTVTETRAEPQGILRVTASVSMAEIIGIHLFELVDTYPAIRLELEFTDRTVDLVGEGVDIAIRPGSLADSSLIARSLGASQAGYFASPAYVKRRGIPKRPRELVERDHACIVFASTSRGNRWLFGKGAKREEVNVPRTHVTNSLAVVRHAVVSGYGIGWLPGAQTLDLVSTGTLVPILERYWPPPMPVSLVYPSARHLAPQVRVAIEHLQSRLTYGIVPR
jgi:LysR family transcriptional regulator for bpeEF and oprC